MKKRLVALLLVLALFVPCSQSAIIANASTLSADDFKYNAIIDEILMIDQSISASNDDFYVVSIPEQGVSQTQTSATKNSKLAIRTTERKDNFVEVTTFYPYKIAENGELINSFEYTPKQTRDDTTYNFRLVDTVVAVTVYYYEESHIYGIPIYYRHLGVKAKWTSDNSTVSVSRMYVKYESCGDLHKYPECILLDQYESLIQEDYLIRSEIIKTNPYNGQICVSLDPMMPDNRMLDFADGMNHGGIVYIEVDYSVNGTQRNYWHAYNAYL